jgi:lysophospholipase L1-like esterase
MRISSPLGALVLAGLAGLAAPGLAQTSATYLAFGDSITGGTGDDEARTEKGYPPRLEALLSTGSVTATVENHGLGGEETGEGLTRIDAVLVGARAGETLLLMEGTNDISREVSVQTMLFNLDEMARKAEAKGLRVVHATVIPRYPNARIDEDNVVNQQLNGLIRNLAGLRNRGLADPFEVFTVETDLFARLYSPSNSDPVGHPNAAGYDLLAEIFADVLTDVDSVPPVHGVLSPLHGERGVRPDVALDVDVWDFGSGIDLPATTLVVNGAAVMATVSGDAEHAELRYQPPAPLTGIVTVGLRGRDLATPPNTVDRTIARFVISGTTFFPGDIDENGRVDGTDLITLGFHFGASRGGRNYEAEADLNGDGAIDGLDLAILAADFGKSSL